MKGSAIIGAPAEPNVASGAILPIRIRAFTDSSGNTTTDVENMSENTKWDPDSSTCTNALRRLAYSVRYNHTEIVEVSVEIETTDVKGTAQELEQEFAVDFYPVEIDLGDRKREKNNVITRIRSGNPGYVAGKPVLGGMSPNVNYTASYVIAQKAGFAVMDTGIGGQCGSSSPTGSIVAIPKDTFVGCTQSFTRKELKEFCTSNEHTMHKSSKVGADRFVFPKWLQSNQNLLGIFGNADPLDGRQWIKIESALDDPNFQSRAVVSWRLKIAA